MASIQEGSDGRGVTVKGTELTHFTVRSPYGVYFRHTLNSAIPMTLTYSLVTGYGDARRAFPLPKHIPAKVVWDNSKQLVKTTAAPIFGTMLAFNLARCWYETNHPSTSQFELAPMVTGMCVGGIPAAISVLIKKPQPALFAGLVFGVLDYMYDRYSIQPMGPSTWSR